MRFIPGTRFIAAVMLPSSFFALALPAQAETKTFSLSIACRVSVRAISSTETVSCVAGRDGATMKVAAGDTVRLVATTAVASWSGCTVTSSGPDYSCSVKMDSNKDVGNTAPLKVQTTSTAPPSTTTNGSARF